MILSRLETESWEDPEAWQDLPEAALEEVRCWSPWVDSPLHGLDHWKRVNAHAQELLVAYQSDNKGPILDLMPPEASAILCLASLFHDSLRYSKGEDSFHGARSAVQAFEILPAWGCPETVTRAVAHLCANHTYAEPSDRITHIPDEFHALLHIFCDADRLDLPRGPHACRLGIWPRHRFFFTERGKLAARDMEASRYQHYSPEDGALLYIRQLD